MVQYEVWRREPNATATVSARGLVEGTIGNASSGPADVANQNAPSRISSSGPTAGGAASVTVGRLHPRVKLRLSIPHDP